MADKLYENIEIKREGADGKATTVEVDYKAVLAGKLADPSLQSGDLLLVKESFF